MKKRFDTTDIINVAELKKQALMKPSITPTITLLVNEMLGKTITITSGMEVIIGRSEECDVSLDITALSRKHCAVFRQGKNVFVRDLDSTNGTFVNGERIETRVLKNGDRVFLGDICVFKFAFTDQIDLDINRMLFDKATRDPLTGIYNRTYFQENCRKEFLFHHRTGLPLSLVFFDLDDFKLVNDRYGHTCGDIVLKDVVFIVKRKIREIDFFSRYGGEEMVILMKNTDYPAAMKKTEILREALFRHKFEYGATSLSVTASFGVVTLKNGNFNSFQEMLAAVDSMMYKAKQEGKNRVVGIEPDK
ncbi:MAG: GGDEF domain-containing protein [Acidobacteria bacterium]|nr:GGDEF domain-containing protein [Acidobacteriota bacterium]